MAPSPGFICTQLVGSGCECVWVCVFVCLLADHVSPSCALGSSQLPSGKPPGWAYSLAWWPCPVSAPNSPGHLPFESHSPTAGSRAGKRHPAAESYRPWREDGRRLNQKNTMVQVMTPCNRCNHNGNRSGFDEPLLRIDLNMKYSRSKCVSVCVSLCVRAV